MDLAKKSGRSREEPPNDFKNSRELTKKIIHQSLVLGSTILKFILRIKRLTLYIFKIVSNKATQITNAQHLFNLKFLLLSFVK